MSLDRNRGKLICSPYHLPYNHKLIPRAQEMRRNMTEAEKKLWFGFLKDFRLKIYPQRPIDHYIVDFYCPKLKLVIEIDGEIHSSEEGKKYDEERDAILAGSGLMVLRFSNNDVRDHFTEVCDAIEHFKPDPPCPP